LSATVVTTLSALSPLDGRYRSKVIATSQVFSESALIARRVQVEVSYILWLSQLGLIPALTQKTARQVTDIAKNFSLTDAETIKKIEQTTHHDVKAVEYFLTQKLIVLKSPIASCVHLGLTSEDTNALAVGLCLKAGLQTGLLPKLRQVLTALADLGYQTADLPLLARTHGQPAVPTTLGKEILVFADRLRTELQVLEQLEVEGKLTGAVGNFNAHQIIWPNADWLKLSAEFITSLGLKPQLVTTQILPAESYSRIFSSLVRINGILLDLTQDIWRYISDGCLIQKPISGQVGSSTMPHKVNPIDFENAEGNLGLATNLLQHFIIKLPISRLQRDLSDSTVKRNFGVAFGYSELAYDSLLVGLKKLQPNHEYLAAELEAHWEVVTEGYQVLLRATGDTQGYQKLQQLVQGKIVTKALLHSWVKNLTVTSDLKTQLLALTPQNYIGLATQIAHRTYQTIIQYLAAARSLESSYAKSKSRS